jgi:hypothetical protein
MEVSTPKDLAVSYEQTRSVRSVMVVRPCAVALLCLLTLSVGNAEAEVGYPTPTVQAVAADATWLAYAPAPAHPGIVCMVDSGVDPNPDTETAVIGGQAIASETDTLDEVARLEPRVQPGNHPDGHGTLMAMMMAAPVNGWGMVGIAPTSVRVYNMKALPKGQATFPFNYYAIAIDECEQVHKSAYPSMSVINLSLGGELEPSATELKFLEDNVEAAHISGINVVAAAGNEGGKVLYPAAYRSILAVGAGEAGSNFGAFCSFASRGEGLDVTAPGCDSQTGGLEGAFEDDGSPAVGSGSSQAAALVSAALASMRAFAPQLTFKLAEECIASTTKSRFVDIAAAFEACGLSQTVNEGKAAERASTTTIKTADSSQSAATQTVSGALCVTKSCVGASSLSVKSQAKKSCPVPRIRSLTRPGGQGGLVMHVRNEPNGCRLEARWRTRRDGGYRIAVASGWRPNALRFTSRSLYGLQVRYVSRTPSCSSSRWMTVGRAR